MLRTLSLIASRTAIFAVTATALFGGYVPNSQDFNLCPSIGVDLVKGCMTIFVIGPKAGSDYPVVGYMPTTGSGGNLTPYIGPYDGADDALVGVLNLSGDRISSLTLGVVGPRGIGLTGQPIFFLDGDGLCSYMPAGSGCPFGPTGYEGPNTRFSYINNNPLSVDPHGGMTSGDISFTGGLQTGNPNDASTFAAAFRYFSLEDLFVPNSASDGCVLNCGASISSDTVGALAFPSNVQLRTTFVQSSIVQTAASAAVPEPASWLLAGCVCLLPLWRRRRRAGM